ncbi:MAG TPA: hypothetical protein DEA78_19360 [Cyanobacteria bacterium UBA11159]|nr:hypothetical protein [Cyanobacteria bacterium UBA11366]HBK66030.1 hypothetical protein [Cyanobacteria bacterium UBA11166]HBR75798.1 hypothetical protein [Cyanobacteria bacterium UBA11159]HBS69703.1 hypothetical protein [Cyanobacteria bacterium UBA11153]HCA94365.1 hypothetical protein [Cyanobacteria bacterium UBA9226]
MEEKYIQRVREVGECNFLVCLFQNYFDSMMRSLMNHFFFVWKDLHYQYWLKIIRQIADNSLARFGFIIFCGFTLAIDIKKVILEDEYISDSVKQYFNTSFVRGTPGPDSPFVEEMFKKHGMEATTMWKRFQEEGAPMKVDV